MIELLGKNKAGRVKKKTTKTKVYSGQQRRNTGRQGIDRGGYSPIQRANQRGILSNDTTGYRPVTNYGVEYNIPTQEVPNFNPTNSFNVNELRRQAQGLLYRHNLGQDPITDGTDYETVSLIADYYPDNYLASNYNSLSTLLANLSSQYQTPVMTDYDNVDYSSD